MKFSHSISAKSKQEALALLNSQGASGVPTSVTNAVVACVEALKGEPTSISISIAGEWPDNVTGNTQSGLGATFNVNAS